MMWADSLYVTPGGWPELARRQTQSLKAMLKRLAYAQFVRNFTWTFHYVGYSQFQFFDSHVYEVMGMLGEVRMLDLAVLSSDPNPYRPP